MISGLEEHTVTVLTRLANVHHIPSSQKRYMEIIHCLEPVRQRFLNSVKKRITILPHFTDVCGDTFFDHTGNIWIGATYKNQHRILFIYNMDAHTSHCFHYTDLKSDELTKIFSTQYMAPLVVRAAINAMYNECLQLSKYVGYAKCIGYCTQFTPNDAAVRRFIERMGEVDSDSSDEDDDDGWNEPVTSTTDTDNDPDYEKWDIDLLLELGGGTQYSCVLGSMEDVD